MPSQIRQSVLKAQRTMRVPNAEAICEAVHAQDRFGAGQERAEQTGKSASFSVASEQLVAASSRCL